MGVEGIILAAGLSSRAKAFKMTLEFRGKTIIESTIDSMLEICSRVIVVGGYGIERLEPIVEKYQDVELVFNEGYEKGMFSSVIKGMGLVREDRFFLTPGDYPLITADVYREMIKINEEIVIPTFQGRRGHPVLFSRTVVKEILEGKKYESLREFIGSRSPKLIPVECRGILMDVDTMEDYKEVLRETERRGRSNGS